MTTKRVYYFCKQVFHPRSWSGSEVVCYRMTENDPRIGTWTRDWQTKGFIFDYPWLPDQATEMAYLRGKYRYERVGKLTIKDAPTDEVR